jgi:hypothetical protein
VILNYSCSRRQGTLKDGTCACFHLNMPLVCLVCALMLLLIFKTFQQKQKIHPHAHTKSFQSAWRGHEVVYGSSNDSRGKYIWIWFCFYNKIKSNKKITNILHKLNSSLAHQFQYVIHEIFIIFNRHDIHISHLNYTA